MSFKQNTVAVVLVPFLAVLLSAQEPVTTNQLPGTMVIPFREAPLIIVPRIGNSLDGGWGSVKYGTYVAFPQPIQAAGQITSTFENLLQETNKFRILKELPGALAYEMFASDTGRVQVIEDHPDLLRADYAFLASLSTLDIGVNTANQAGIVTEKVTFTVRFAISVIDLHPEKNWHVVDSTDKVFSHERFATEEEATKEAKRLQAFSPDSQFTVLPPPPRKAGEVVWGKNFGFSLAETYVTKAPYYKREINLVREELVLDAMSLALEKAMAEWMEVRWPLRAISIDLEKQEVNLNQGGWMIRHAGWREGIPRLKQGKLTEKVRVPPHSLFSVYRPGEVLRDPSNGIFLGQKKGEELAVLKVFPADIEPRYSTAKIIRGDLSSSDLSEVMIKPIGIDQILKEVEEQNLSRISDMRNFVKTAYNLELTKAWFKNISTAPKTPRRGSRE